MVRGQDVDGARERLAKNIVSLGAQLVIPRSLRDAGHGIGAELGLIPDMAAGLAEQAEPSEFYDPDGEQRVLRYLETYKGGMILAAGGRRKGKTSMLFYLADFYLRSGRKKRAFIPGYPPAVLKNTPLRAIKWDVDVLCDTLDRDDLLIMPDMGRLLNSRDFGSDMDEVFGALMELAGQYGITMLGDVQNTSLVSKHVFDVDLMLYKPLGEGWEINEREGLIRRAKYVQKAFASLPLEERNQWAVAFCEEVGYTGLIRARQRAPWQTLALSEAHSQQDLRELLNLRRRRNPARDTSAGADDITDARPGPDGVWRPAPEGTAPPT